MPEEKKPWEKFNGEEKPAGDKPWDKFSTKDVDIKKKSQEPTPSPSPLVLANSTSASTDGESAPQKGINYYQDQAPEPVIPPQKTTPLVVQQPVTGLPEYGEGNPNYFEGGNFGKMTGTTEGRMGEMPSQNEADLLRAATTQADITQKDQSQFNKEQYQKDMQLSPLTEAAGRGVAQLGKTVLSIPGGIYDVLNTYINNPINAAIGNGQAPSASQIAESIPEEWSVIKQLDDATKKSAERTQQVYDKEINEYFFGDKPDYKKGAESLGLAVVETVPTTIGLMAALWANPTAAGPIAAAGFAEEKKRQLDENPNTQNMTEQEKMGIGVLSGTMEMAFEELGLSGKLGPVLDNIVKTSTKEIAEKEAKELFKRSYAKIAKQYLGIHAEEVLGEMGNQFAQNVLDKYTGVDPERKLSDGVFDAGLIAMAASTSMAGPTMLADIAVTREAKKRAKEFEKNRQTLSDTAANPDVSDAVRQVAQEKLRKINEDEANIAEQEKKTASELTDEAKAETQRLSQEADKIESVLQDPTMPEDTRKILEEELANKEKEIDAKIKAGKKTTEQMAKEAEAANQEMNDEIEYLNKLKNAGVTDPEIDKRLEELQGVSKGVVEGENKSEPIELSTETEPINTQTNDTQNIEGVPSEVGVGQQEPVQAQPNEATGGETPQASGTLQTQEEITPPVAGDSTVDTGGAKETPTSVSSTEKPKKNSQESLNKLDNDIELMKKMPDEDKAKLKFEGALSRAYKAWQSGEISKAVYNDFRNRAKEVLGGKYEKKVDASHAKMRVEEVMANVKKKLVGEGMQNVALSSMIPITPKTVADFIDVATHVTKKLIDANATVQTAMKQAVEIVKKHPAFKKLVSTGEINEQDFENAVNEEMKKLSEPPQETISENKSPASDAVEEQSGEAPVQGGKTEAKKGKRTSVKALSNNIFNAKNISPSMKEVIEKLGLKREVFSHAEAEEMAARLIDEVGEREAGNIVLDPSNSIPGNTRLFVFANIMESIRQAEENMTNQSDKESAAELQAEFATKMEEVMDVMEKMSTEAGRLIGGIGHFYKMSPLGIKKKMQRDIQKSQKASKDRVGKKDKKTFKDLTNELQDIDEETSNEKESWAGIIEEEESEPKRISKPKPSNVKKREGLLSKLKTLLNKSAPTPQRIVELSKEQIDVIAEMAATYVDDGIETGSEVIRMLKEDLKGSGLKLTRSDVDKIKNHPEYGKGLSELFEAEKQAKAKEKSDAKIEQLLSDIKEGKTKQRKKRTPEEIAKIKEEKATEIGKAKSFINQKYGKRLTDEEVIQVMAEQGDAIVDQMAKEKKLKAVEKALSKPNKKKSAQESLNEAEKMLELYDAGAAIPGSKFENAFYEKLGILNLDRKDVQEKLDYFSKKIFDAPEGILKNEAMAEYMDWLTEAKASSRLEAGIAYWYANLLSSYETQTRNIQFNTFTAMVNGPALLATKAIQNGDFKQALKYFGTVSDAIFGENIFQNIKEGEFKKLWENTKGTRGATDFINVLKTGALTSFEDGGKASGFFERKIRASKDPITKGVFTVFAVPSRMLRGADAFFSNALYNAKTREVAIEQAKVALKENGVKEPTPKQLNDVVNEMMLGTSQRKKLAKEESEKDIEKFYGKDWKSNAKAVRHQRLREFEIMENSRPKEVGDRKGEARAWAQKHLLTNKPEGVFGAVADAINLLSNVIPPFRLFMPFVNVPLNLTNLAIERSPLGFIKAYGSPRVGFEKFEGTFLQKYHRELSEDEIRELRQKALNYTALMAGVMVYVLAKGGMGDDDDNASIVVTGKEGDDWYENMDNQKGDGLKPFTIYKRINGDLVEMGNYLNTPFFPIFYPTGSLRDYNRKAAKMEQDKSVAQAIMFSAGAYMGQTTNQASMKGVNSLLKYMDADEVEKMKVETMLGSTLKGAQTLIPLSGLVKAANNDVKGALGLPEVQATNPYEYLTRGLPFDYAYGKPKKDVLGQNVSAEFSVPMVPIETENFSSSKSYPYIKTMVDKKFDIERLFTKTGKVYSNGADKELTKEELYELNALRGQILFNAIQEKYNGTDKTLFDKWSELGNKEFAHYLDDANKKATMVAKMRLYALTPEENKMYKDDNDLYNETKIRKRLSKPGEKWDDDLKSFVKKSCSGGF